MKLFFAPHLLLLAASTGVLLMTSGCSSAPSGKEGVARTEVVGPVNQASSDHAQTGPAQSGEHQHPIAWRPLTEAEMALLLQAEMALYRQQQQQAGRLYLAAAELTRDIGVTRRAFEVATALSNNEDALQLAQLWMELDPGVTPRRHAAQLFARVGETEAAWELAHPIQDEGFALRVVAAETRSMGGRDRAAWLDQQIAGLDHRSYELLVARALLNEGMRNYEVATEFARLAYISRPEEALAVELYGTLLAFQGQTGELAALLRQWLPRHWRNQPEHQRVAQLVSRLPGDEAIDILRQTIANRRFTAELNLLLIRAYIRQERFTEAEDQLRQLTAVTDLADQAFLLLAQLAEAQGDWSSALDNYAGVRPGQLFEQANRRAADLLLGLNQPATTIEQFFSDQRQRYPQESEGLYLLEASLYNDLRLSTELYRTTTSGLQLAPTRIELLYLRSLASERMDQIDRAEADLRRILDIDPEHVAALNALGYLLTDRTDHHEEAYVLIRRALDMDPENPAIIDSMGWVLFKLGRYDEALLYLQEAHARYYDEEIILHLAETLIKLDRQDEARALILEAMEQLPDSDLIRTTRQRLFPELEQR